MKNVYEQQRITGAIRVQHKLFSPEGLRRKCQDRHTAQHTWTHVNKIGLHPEGKAHDQHAWIHMDRTGLHSEDKVHGSAYMHTRDQNKLAF